MGIVVSLLAVVAVLASILLMFVILLQEPKGGGIAAALGGSGMEAIGPSIGGVNRFTGWVAGVWMVSCFLHAIWTSAGPELTTAPKAPASQQGTNKPGETGGGENPGGGGAGGRNPPAPPPGQDQNPPAPPPGDTPPKK